MNDWLLKNVHIIISILIIIGFISCGIMFALSC
jgi:hypothetical protein